MYRAPSPDTTGQRLVGQQIQIYWDGDDAFYSGRVMSYDPEKMTHLILYFDGVRQEENLSITPWKIYDPSVFEVKPARSQAAEETRNRRAKAQRQEQESQIEKLRKMRDFYLASHLTVLKPFIRKSPHYRCLKRTELLLPLGDPMLDTHDVESGLVPMCVSATENMLKLVESGILSSQVVSFVNMNPGAVTIGGGYASRSVLPPLHTARNTGDDAHALLSKDATCIGHTIIYDEHSETYQTMLLDPVEHKANSVEHGTFAGYVIVWPGCRLSNAVTYEEWDGLSALVDSGSIVFDVSNVYFLEKKVIDVSSMDHRTLRLTALRLHAGTFLPLPSDLVSSTMNYATHATIPVSNLITFKYICPHENIVKTVQRQYCDSRHYHNVLERTIRRARRGRNSNSAAAPPDNIVASNHLALDDEKIFRAILSTALPLEVTRQSMLRSCHMAAVKWMVSLFKNGAPMILRDSSGEGKEVEVAAFIASVLKMNGDGRSKSRGSVLIVCPLTSILRWQEGLKHFFPITKFVCFSGSRINMVKQKKLWSSKQAFCLLTSFDMLVEEKAFFDSNNFWSCVIVDRAAGPNDLIRVQKANEILLKVPCRVLLPSKQLPSSTEPDSFRIWSELNFIAPDIFSVATESSFEAATPRKILSAAHSLIYSSSPDDMQSGFEIVDINIIVPLSLLQLTAFLAARNLLNSKCTDKTTTATPNLIDIYNYAPVILSSSVKGENDEKSVSSLEALLQRSSKICLLNQMLPSLEDDGRVVMLLCHSEDMMSILKDYCVLKEYPSLRLRKNYTMAEELDIQYLCYTAKDVFVYLLLVDDEDQSTYADIDIPAVDTIIRFDVGEGVHRRGVGHVASAIRRCNPLVIYTLRSGVGIDGSVDSDVFSTVQADGCDSPYEVFGPDNILNSAEISVLMSVGGEFLEKGIPAKEHTGSKRLLAGPWRRECLQYGEGTKSRSQNIQIRGDSVNSVDITKATLSDTTPVRAVPTTSQKTWTNVQFCCLCGCHELSDQMKGTETKYHKHNLINCKLCPRSFHRKCFEDSSLPLKELVLEESVCPQHLCACGANSGIMCPCVDCLTVYCEKCIPLRDVESLGRRTETAKECDFYSRAYHYIRCDYCSQVENAEVLTDSDRSTVGFYFISAKENKSRAGADEILPTDVPVRHNLIILPSQMTRCYNKELDSSRKRKRKAVEETPIMEEDSSVGAGSGEEAEEDDISMDPTDGSTAFYIYLSVDGNDILLFKKMTIGSDSMMKFVDILSDSDAGCAKYADVKRYSMVVSAHMTKNDSDDTKIYCNVDDEVVGAIFLGYKYIRFEATSVSLKRPRP